MATHISYEISAAADALERWVRRSGDPLYLDAALLHMRTLIEFLVGRPKSRHINDLWPTDHVPSWSVEQTRSQFFRAQLDDIDKLLSHLSLSRLVPDGPPPGGTGFHMQQSRSSVRSLSSLTTGHGRSVRKRWRCCPERRAKGIEDPFEAQ